MRIGVLGGTFDPVHLGHLLLAEGARQVLGLDRVLWVPARISPHKRRRPHAATQDRYRMVKLAIAGHPHFQVSKIELNRPGPSYTIDTIRQLRREAPKGTRWFLLLGSDAAAQLPSWREIDELKKLVHCVFIPRSVPRTKIKNVPGTVIDVETAPISASEIRQRIKRGHTVRYWVPEGVYRYIQKRRLYR